MDSDEIAAHLLERMRLRILSPLTTLVGLDLIDLIDPRLKSAARRLAQQMLSDDEREAAQTVIDVMALLWPDTDPEDEDPTWWHTPLGQQVARSIGEDNTAVTYRRAATMLGVQRGTVSKWVQRGTLDRHPDGGVRLGSVLERLHPRNTHPEQDSTPGPSHRSEDRGHQPKESPPVAVSIHSTSVFLDGPDDVKVQTLSNNFATLEIGRLTIFVSSEEFGGRTLADLLTIAEIGDRIAEQAKAKAAELANAATVEQAQVEADA